MSEKLGETLHRLWIELLVRQAQMIGDYPRGEERTSEARKLLYSVMYEFALGRLSRAEREQILSWLDFVRDRHAPESLGRDEANSTLAADAAAEPETSAERETDTQRRRP
ncbi:MAG: hypothetical protein GX575_27190 [Candidatus Anammoximicrobium sp.]|nr:hypothetical protein [Candidatus Anammoximicrobium sp.]